MRRHFPTVIPNFKELCEKKKQQYSSHTSNLTYKVILNVYSNSDSLLFSVTKNQFSVNKFSTVIPNFKELCEKKKQQYSSHTSNLTYNVILNVYSNSDSLLFSVIENQVSVNN